MKRAIILLPLGLILAVAACENRNAVPLGKDFGNAVQHNMSVHIINPDPVTAGYGAPALDGKRARGAMDRYHEREVTPSEVGGTSVSE